MLIKYDLLENIQLGSDVPLPSPITTLEIIYTYMCVCICTYISLIVSVLFYFFCLLDFPKVTDDLFIIIRYVITIINCAWITDVHCHIFLSQILTQYIKACFFKQLWRWACSTLPPNHLYECILRPKLHWPPNIILFSVKWHYSVQYFKCELCINTKNI